MKSANLRMGVSVSVLVAVALSWGGYSWCDNVGGCTFGKYTAEVTLSNLQTGEPLENRKLRVYLDNGRFPLTNTGEGKIFITGANGKADIVFRKSFHSPLRIVNSVSSLNVNNLFLVNPDDIRGNVVIPQDKVGSSVGGRLAEETEPVKLEIAVGDWSLFLPYGFNSTATTRQRHETC